VSLEIPGFMKNSKNVNNVLTSAAVDEEVPGLLNDAPRTPRAFPAEEQVVSSDTGRDVPPLG
jgi:hypothetical protein